MKSATPLTRLQTSGASWLRAFACACLAVGTSSVLAITPVNTEITNTATARFELNGQTTERNASVTLITENVNPGERK